MDLWESPPFAPAVRGGLIHARGATDNKGQTFSHLIGLHRSLAEGPLPVQRRARHRHGLGQRPNRLLPVHDGLNFLDLIARQVLHFRKTSGHMRLLTMNSFSTSADTRAALAKYPELGHPDDIELLQNKTPKVDVKTLRPVEWEKDRELEWCPPGHGDLYAVLATGGTLDRLLSEGIRYVFVSNSDNLGATLDLSLLTWFAQTEAPFMMEVTACHAAADSRKEPPALRPTQAAPRRRQPPPPRSRPMPGRGPRLVP